MMVLRAAGLEVELVDVPEHAQRVLSAAGAPDHESSDSAQAGVD